MPVPFLRVVSPPSSAGQIPPHSLESEAAVLSAVLIDPVAIERVAAIVEPRDFYLNTHTRIFEAALAVHQAGVPIDVVTVGKELGQRERLAQIGGMAYLTELLHAAPAVSPRALKAYARSVLDCARVRRTIAACQRIAAEGYFDVGDVSQWLADASERVREASALAAAETIARNVDRLKQMIADMVARANGKLPSGLATGLADYDRLTGGLHAGQVTVVGARPNMGKTALATTIAMNVAEAGVGVLLFSLEQSQDELLYRVLSARTRIDSLALKQGKLSAEQWRTFHQAVHDLAPWPLLIDERTDLTPTQLRARTLECMRDLETRKTPLGLVIIDYLQRISSVSDWLDLPRHEQVARIARSIKPLARETGVPLLVLAQLNRVSTQRSDKNKRPNMADLAESGEIEKGADVVALLHRESYYRRDKPDDGRAELIIDKHRDGPTGIVRLSFDARCTRFDASAEDSDE